MNGRQIGEIAEMAWLAGNRGIPVVAVAGDEAACAEAGIFVPDAELAAVKKALAPRQAQCLQLDDAQRLIEDACYRGLTAAGRGAKRPVVLDGPVRMEVTFKVPDAVSLAAVLPRSTVDGATVAYEAADFGEALRAYLCALALLAATRS